MRNVDIVTIALLDSWVESVWTYVAVVGIWVRTVYGQTWQWSEFGYGRFTDRRGSGRNLGTDGVWTDVVVVGIWVLSPHERVNKKNFESR
jgi:threonine/homoserine efflux transporter RhtA